MTDVVQNIRPSLWNCGSSFRNVNLPNISNECLTLCTGIYPGSDEYKFWELAVNLVKEYSGWGGYSELPKEFLRAVRYRDKVHGTLNFET